MAPKERLNQELSGASKQCKSVGELHKSSPANHASPSSNKISSEHSSKRKRPSSSDREGTPSDKRVKVEHEQSPTTTSTPSPQASPLLSPLVRQHMNGEFDHIYRKLDEVCPLLDTKPEPSKKRKLHASIPGNESCKHQLMEEVHTPQKKRRLTQKSSVPKPSTTGESKKKVANKEHKPIQPRTPPKIQAIENDLSTNLRLIVREAKGSLPYSQAIKDTAVHCRKILEEERERRVLNPEPTLNSSLPSPPGQ